MARWQSTIVDDFRECDDRREAPGLSIAHASADRSGAQQYTSGERQGVLQTDSPEQLFGLVGIF
jgi:hypothetical protein